MSTQEREDDQTCKRERTVGKRIRTMIRSWRRKMGETKQKIRKAIGRETKIGITKIY